MWAGQLSPHSDGKIIVMRNRSLDGSGRFCKTHGQAFHPLYNRWRGLKARCTNPNSLNYPIYGGRGIALHPSWHNFKPFFDWATSSGWKPHLQIDRIDNDGPYCPSNCHWVTPKVNARNRRDNHPITFNGKTQCLAEWADELGMLWHTLSNRLRRGWSIERALTTPIH